MELRDPREGDVDGIQEVARASLSASYESVLDADAIDRFVEETYGPDRIERYIEEPTSVFTVAGDGSIDGFVQGELVEGEHVVGHVHWLHVRPDARGAGVGAQLLGEALDRMESNGAVVVRGHVLAANEDGIGFYEAHDFEEVTANTTSVGDEEYDELVFERTLGDAGEAVAEPQEGPDGEELFVDYSGSERGTEAPFYPLFHDEGLDEKFGWLCSNCDSVETTMGSSGRIQCAHCENVRTATRWDGSYL